MDFLVDEDKDGHTMDEGFALATDVAGAGLTVGGVIAGGLGTLGGGLSAGLAGVGAGVAGAGTALATAGGAAMALGGSAAVPTGGLSVPLVVGGAGLSLLGAGMMGGGAGLGIAGALGGALSTGVGVAGGAAVGLGQLLQTDRAGDAAAMLGDFTHDQLGDGGEPAAIEALPAGSGGSLPLTAYGHYGE